ncbi:MAG TPA: beta-galactosidase, partial [Puia sp.]|nr:beta-galactosidase [Puia sp.]
MKKFLVAASLVLTTTAIVAQRRLDFDEGWKFHLGNASDPHRDFNYGIGNILSKTGEADHTCIRMDFDDKDWQDVQLPHDWAVGLPFAHVANGDVDAHGYHAVGGLFPENSIGWYRKTFTVDRADSGRRVLLQFDGIFRDSKVWINNCYLGGNFSGYTGSSYDVTDFLHYGGKNTVVVRVDASQYEGWFYEGAGIYRHAWLNIFDDLHIDRAGGVFVHTRTTGG